MGFYSDLTDEELTAEIAAYRLARRDVIIGGGGGVGTVRKVSDGDRMLEYTRANLRDLDIELNALLKNRAAGPIHAADGRAIRVEFD
jgi:hypothetical protein